MSVLSDDPAYLEGRAAGWETGYEAGLNRAKDLVTKAKHLVDLMDDAERNHGSLVGAKTLRGVNELRLELSKWR